MHTTDQSRTDPESRGAANHSSGGGISLPGRPVLEPTKGMLPKTAEPGESNTLPQGPYTPVAQLKLTDYLPAMPARNTMLSAAGGAVAGVALTGAAVAAGAVTAAASPFIVMGAAGAAGGVMLNNMLNGPPATAATARPAGAGGNAPAREPSSTAGSAGAAGAAGSSVAAMPVASARPASMAGLQVGPQEGAGVKKKISPEQNTLNQKLESKTQRDKETAASKASREQSQKDQVQARDKQAAALEAQRVASWPAAKAVFLAAEAQDRATHIAAAVAATNAATGAAYWLAQWNGFKTQFGTYDDDFVHRAPNGQGAYDKLLAAFREKLAEVRESQRIVTELPGAQAQWNGILAAGAGANRSNDMEYLIQHKFIRLVQTRWYTLADQAQYGVSLRVEPFNGLVSAQNAVVHLHCRRVDGVVLYASVKYGGGADAELAPGTGVNVTGARAEIWRTDKTYNQMVADYGAAQ